MRIQEFDTLLKNALEPEILRYNKKLSNQLLSFKEILAFKETTVKAISLLIYIKCLRKYLLLVLNRYLQNINFEQAFA